MRYLMVLAVMALATSAFAQDTAKDEAEVTLLIEEFCWVEIAEDSLDIVISGGDNEGEASSGWTSNANFAYKVSGSLTEPPGAPGTWTLSGASGSGAAGSEVDGTLTVKVTGITMSNAADYWDEGEVVLNLEAQ